MRELETVRKWLVNNKGKWAQIEHIAQVSTKTMSKIVAGHEPSIRTLRRLKEAKDAGYQK